MMSGLAWATVGEMEPKLQHLDKLIEQTIPNKLQKIEACLGPAQQKLEESQKLYEDQVCTGCNCCEASCNTVTS